MAALDALDRERTVVIVTVSPLEQHGPHLPLGVDAFTARHLAESLAERLVVRRPGWTAVLAPTLYLGSFTFEAPGTVRVRQRVLRDALVDYGDSLARAGFRYIFLSNGHAGPGHLVALEEAAGVVSRRHRITMASLTGALAWEFLRGRLSEKIEGALNRSFTEEERQAFTEDAHGGWWETSMMLLLRPDLVDPSFRALAPARYSLAERLRPNYPLKGTGRGYVGHPGLADPSFARAVRSVLLDEALAGLEGLIDGRIRPGAHRSPFFAIPLLRTNFWPALGAALAALTVALLCYAVR